MNLKLSYRVNQTLVIKIDQEVVTSQKVSSNDRILYVSYNEDPPKRATQSQIQCQGSPTQPIIFIPELSVFPNLSESHMKTYTNMGWFLYIVIIV